MYAGYMRPGGSATQLEQRRLRAVQLLEAGQKPAAVAQQLGTTLRSVLRWKGRGKDDLARKPPPGPPSKLTESQERLVRGMLRGGEFRSGNNWVIGSPTPRNIANFFSQHFDVHFHPKHIPRLLTRLGGVYEPYIGWSYQEKEGVPRTLKRPPGRPPRPRLSEKQQQWLRENLAQRVKRLAEAWESRTRKEKDAYASRTKIKKDWLADRREAWCTPAIIRRVLLEKFGIGCHIVYLRDLLKQLNWKPCKGFGWLPNGHFLSKEGDTTVE